MNETLKKLIMRYSVENQEKLIKFLKGFSKPKLICTLLDLLTIYFNDKNSSKLRELTTLWICGFEPNLEKLGYNGYRLSFATGKKEYCEVKPQNTDNPKKKLNGGGSFNDYTKERFLKDLKENPTILISGFVGGKLIYIIEIKFECLKERLENLLNKRFPQGRSPGEFLRSASFSLKDYINCPYLKLAYLRKDWKKFKDYLTIDLISFLEGKRK
jgi:hypothetical protein